jgi:hypothetical protein
MRESTVVAKWKAEGRAEGFIEGFAEGMKEDLLLLLGHRFGGNQLSADLIRTIEVETSIETLSQWLIQGLDAESLETFRAAIAR